jgi:hypothetical protein
MKSQTFTLELITPCFCGGAEPDKQAEIRAPSIRGQLRWWFRTLGGFKSLGPMPVREQEALIFGSTAGDEGRAGKLIIRIAGPQPKSTPANADDLDAGMNTPLGYALFPLRPFGANDGKRGKFSEQTEFRISVMWRGSGSQWNDIQALLALWAHLGALGFRSRRTVGALRLISPTLSLKDALSCFAVPQNICIRKIQEPNLHDWRAVSAALLKWYRSWRQHGQMNQTWQWNDRRDRSKGGRWIPIPAQQKQQNRTQPGFRYARRDHNEGLDVQGIGAPNPDPENPHGRPGETYRPALGLPIIQFFSSLGGARGPLPRGQATVNWEYGRGTEHEPKGRFASPVLLRPHKDAQGNWHALVIFVDAHRWPEGKPVFLNGHLNGQPRNVSLDLYNAMKADRRLQPFLS